MATIPQRELRNNVSEVLRRAEDGEHFAITVALSCTGTGEAFIRTCFGYHVHARMAFSGWALAQACEEALAQVLAASAVDERWADELDRLRGEDHAAAHDPWAR